MKSEKEKVKTEAAPPPPPPPIQEESAAPIVEVVKKEVNIATPTVTLPVEEPKLVAIGNPFRPSKDVCHRIKMFLWGSVGSGKSYTALHFPRPAVIDAERGTVMYSDEFDFDVKHTSDFDEIVGIVDYLMTNKHNYATLIIDPVTVVWEALQKKWSDIFLARNRGGKGFKHEFYDLQVKDWLTIKQDLKGLIRKLNQLDMNVIITAGEKTKYKEGSMLVALGETFDAERTLPRAFDIVIRLYLTDDNRHMALCTKDRSRKLPTTEFPLSYDIFLKAFGKDFLERDAIPIKFITEEQKKKLSTMFLDFPVDAINKRLTAYDAETIDDLMFENAEIIIKKLETFKKKKKEK